MSNFDIITNHRIFSISTECQQTGIVERLKGDEIKLNCAFEGESERHIDGLLKFLDFSCSTCVEIKNTKPLTIFLYIAKIGQKHRRFEHKQY